MLVAPPGSLKSNIVNTLEIHERVVIMNDANVPSINRLRDDVAQGRYRTLAFTEFEKLYQRNPLTAVNVEGHIRAFVDEGFRHPSWEDSRMASRKAFCLVIGAMTPTCYQKHFTNWEDSGFGRRFLWLHYYLDDPGIITEAIHRWQRIKFPGLTVLRLEEQEIPYNLSERESTELRKMLELDANTPYTLLKKIAVILKNVCGNGFMDIVRDVAPCMKGEGGTLHIPKRFEEDNGKPHHTKTAGRKVRRSGVRRNSGNASQASAKKVRVPRLETERQLSKVPAGSVRNDGTVEG